MRRLWLLLPLLAGCHGDAVSPPTPGTLTVLLSTPNHNDGAVVLVISGGPVSAVHAVGSLEVARQVDASGTHVVVVGDVIEGALVTIDIPDLSRADAYVATLEQVADRTTFALLDPGSYLLTITPQR
jgi:hypothetical protein